MTTTTTKLETVCAELGITINVGKPARKTDSDKWDHVESEVTLSRNGREFWKGPYRQGVACLNKQLQSPTLWAIKQTIDKTNWKAPTVPDVMYSILSDGSAYFDAQTFEEWAIDLGYDTDSRKAESIYKACDEVGRKLSRAFSADELARLREACQDY